MEMHQVRYFLALGEELSFTKAAARCNVSQPSLTRAIKLLEGELGGPLFRRDRGNIQLSELGRIMHPYLNEVDVQANSAKARAQDWRKVTAKRLRLGVMCTIAPSPLLSLFDAMRKEHADVDLEILDEEAACLEKHLLNGKIDIGLYCRPCKSDDRVHYHKVFDERMVIVLSAADRLAEHDELRVSDLNGQPYINRINCEFNGADIPGFSRDAWQTTYRSERDDWVLAMVAAGMGFSFLPQNCAVHPGVIVRPLVDPRVSRQVDLATVRGRPHSSAAGAVVREAMRNTWATARPQDT